LLKLFFAYEREEIADFRTVEQFKADLPEVLKALRDMIERAEKENEQFRAAALKFLKHAKDTINPSVTAADVREMLIQHILTEEIFSQVFDNAEFHHHNNVAKELYALENTFFTGKVKYDTLAALKPYYAAIKSAAALVSSHHEKQQFLKTIYENFYKIYDKKKADRLGVVYTTNEIVRFMIESADWLCQKHFKKSLIDKQVEILDPAVGTGTFITELIEHFRGQPQKLRYKYLEELHANEVAILPYYVANLNIEATYAAINGYEEFPNLCFVDTLDNTAALRLHKGQQADLFGAVSEENVARIKRQNKKKISVIIGNPPYNANQLNESENNKNRVYPEIDRRIKESYIANSTAQKTKLYDIYARFFRWASDRVDENGIVAFITNRSFIESRTFDGFRKMVAAEFNDIYAVDLGGDVRADPRLSGPKHNVFGIQTGVAISFMVKRANAKSCRVRYSRRPQLETAEEKLAFVGNAKLENGKFEEVRPNERNDWINQTANDFDALIPVADRKTKFVKIAGQERAIFKLFSLGVVTNRDDWVYDNNEVNLTRKIRALIEVYEKDRRRLNGTATKKNIGDLVDPSIKWTRALKNSLLADRKLEFEPGQIVRTLYRPYVTRYLYFTSELNEMVYQTPLIWPAACENEAICFCVGGRLSFSAFSTEYVPALTVLSLDANQCLPRWTFSDGEQLDNITDWALGQFRAHYETSKDQKGQITKDGIFHYVYGVLHDPIYREKYREFPRIPFYADFWKWADWGEKLMQLHIGYEAIEQWPLKRNDVRDERSRKAGLPPKAMLKVNKDEGSIQIDTETQLIGFPAETWTYKLGNRSALEWVLDQYKEKTPKDPTIREKFNTYRFADHKEKVIDLLKRITRVSVETMKITDAMRRSQR
jgi:predicted helicase